MKIGIPVAKSKTQVFINQAYVNFVSESGFDPILINDYNDITFMAQICDGLLLPGGIDLEPTFYGEDNVGSIGSDPERDDFERQVLQAFILAGKKVFGICRGFQLMVREFIIGHEIKCAVFHQHVSNHSLASDRNAKRSTPTHSVYANMQELYGEKNHTDMFVNSMHHQALIATKVLNIEFKNGNTIKETAQTIFGLKTKNVKEHIVEAVDITINGCKLRGVQWHPEELNDVKLLQTFFAENNKVLQHGKG